MTEKKQKKKKIKKSIIDDIDNRTREEIESLQLMPPFHGRSYAFDTELYTNEGWKKIQFISGKELFLSPNPNNNLELEWINCIRLITHDPKNLMYEFKSQNFHLLVDKEHFQIYSTQPYCKGRWKIDEVQNLTKFQRVYIPRIPRWTGKNTKFITIGNYKIKTKLFTQFMAFWLKHGSVTKIKNNKNCVNVKMFGNKNIYNIIKHLPFKIEKSGPVIEFNNYDFGKYLESIGNSYSKHIPTEIKELNSYYLKIFLDSYSYKYYKPDISTKPLKVFYTTSKRLSDDLGECILKVGGCPSYATANKLYNNSHDLNLIYWNKYKTEIFGDKEKGTIKKVPYDGNTYCVELASSHGLLVRYKGKVCISMNCRCDIVPIGTFSESRVPTIPK